MKKRVTEFLFASIMMLFTFNACKIHEPENIEPIQEEPVYVTVTFDTDGGNAVEVKSVLKGEAVSAPKAPSKTGYNFTSWQKDGADYDFTKTVTENITLKAVWTPKTYTVTLIDEENVSTITATYGQLLPDFQNVPASTNEKSFQGFFTEENIKYIDKDGKGVKVWALDSDTTLTSLWSYKTPEIKLPDSVGENPFAGKTFIDKNFEGELDESKLDDFEYYTIDTWIFTDSTVQHTGTEWHAGKKTSWNETYRYSYDTEKSILYLAYVSCITEKGAYSTIDEYANLLKKDGISGTDLEARILEELSWFSTMKAKKYEIEEESSLYFYSDYFTGNLPSSALFHYEDNNSFYYLIYGNEFYIYGDDWEIWCYTTFEDGKFTWKIYKRYLTTVTDQNGTVTGSAYSSFEYIGTGSGTYECSGTGTEDCTVTITVTELPETVTEIEKNKPLVFDKGF